MSVAIQAYLPSVPHSPQNPASVPAPKLVHLEPEPETVDTLQERVAQVLSKTPHRLGRGIRCQAERGCVRLEGVVLTYFQKQMAQEAVRRVDGVVEIQNDLHVGQRPEF